MIDTCETCAHLGAPDNLILQTDHWNVILADDQAYVGRSFVTLRGHKSSLSELSPEEWQDFEQLVRRVETSYSSALGSGRPFNWACMMNNAFQLPHPTPHVHWHLRPRHAAAVTINGQVFTDPEYAHHYDRGRKQLVDAGTRAAIMTLLKTSL